MLLFQAIDRVTSSDNLYHPTRYSISIMLFLQCGFCFPGYLCQCGVSISSFNLLCCAKSGSFMFFLVSIY